MACEVGLRGLLRVQHRLRRRWLGRVADLACAHAEERLSRHAHHRSALTSQGGSAALSAPATDGGFNVVQRAGASGLLTRLTELRIPLSPTLIAPVLRFPKVGGLERHDGGAPTVERCLQLRRHDPADIPHARVSLAL